MSALVFWQNILSIHQAPLIREVAKLWHGEVWVVTEADVPADRLNQGWTRPDFSPAKPLVTPSRQVRMDLLGKTDDISCVHIFSGFHAYQETYWTLKQARKTQALIGVFVEPGRHDEGVRTVLRRIRYMIQGMTWRKRLDFLLPTGELGVKWYSSCLFSDKTMHPFGYFVESTFQIPQFSRITDCVSILYVGQLIERKGLDLLLKALAGLKLENWELVIVGDGPQRSALSEMAATLGINDRIIWKGVLSNFEVRTLMETADLLVLPSRFDGWGAVVNEALMSGTRVMVSDACGASDLVCRPEQGHVFKSESVYSLRKELEVGISLGTLKADAREHIAEWARRSMHPSVAARYLLNIIEHAYHGGPKPRVPWREC